MSPTSAALRRTALALGLMATVVAPAIAATTQAESGTFGPAVDIRSKRMHPPVYPVAAFRAGADGTVQLRVSVDAKGDWRTSRSIRPAVVTTWTRPRWMPRGSGPMLQAGGTACPSPAHCAFPWTTASIPERRLPGADQRRRSSASRRSPASGALSM